MLADRAYRSGNGQARGETEPFLDLAQHQPAAFRRQPATVETAHGSLFSTGDSPGG